MKFNLLAAALAAFSMTSSYAAPNPDPLQLKISVDISEPTAAAQGVLLIFTGTTPSLLGNWYYINATLDGKEFPIQNPLPVGAVSMYYYGNCTVFSEDGLKYTLTNYGLAVPYYKIVERPTAFVAGVCSYPKIPDSQLKLGL